MKIRKAVVTCAAPDQRTLPLQRIVDRDGVEKAALRIVLDEVAAAGVEQAAVVICPGDQSPYNQAAEGSGVDLHFIEQTNPRGYGDALHRAADFVGDESFVHLVGDHLYVSASDKRCAQQLVEAATANDCSVSAVQSTRENMLPYYGTVGGKRVPQQTHLYEVDVVREKPTPTEAEQHLIVPGLRAGHYLCLFGMHVLTPTAMQLLAEQVDAGGDATVQLSPALSALAQKEKYLALEVQGDRYNIGVKYGILCAQLASALSGRDRETVLAQLVELLATHQ